MSNTLLTPTMITREALRVLHAKLKFISKVNREYDSRFAVSGAKIGTALQIRKPPQYSVRTGPTLSTQNATETYVSLPVQAQMGVDLTFSSVELTMQIDDFSKRFIDPAMAQLASSIENFILGGGYVESTYYQGLINKVSQQAGNPLASLNSLRAVLKAKQLMTDSLTPEGTRNFLLNTDSTVEMVEGLKGLFQQSNAIGEQYSKGILGTVGGFDFYESTLMPTHTVGAYVGTTPLTDYGTAFVSGTSTLVTNGWTGSVTGLLKAGDIITIEGVYAVHPETKQTLGYLKQFVVTADTDSTSGAASIPIYPAPTYSTSTVNSVTTLGAFNNVSALPGNDKAITVVGTASSTYGLNLAFHQDAFTFATADLEDVTQYGAWGARETYDGISLRIARQYVIGSDTVPTRIEVLFGFAALYPQLACRVANAISAT